MTPQIEARTPPMEVSGEAKAKHLEMAREQGEAYVRALNEMAYHEATTGAEIPVGEFIVAIAVEKAEGMWVPRGDKLEWQEPKEENAHIEVSVRDAADNRFIPALDVQVTVIDGKGQEIGTHKQPFLWHPWLWHYGRNWKLPGDGEYTIRAHIDMPDFPRHDKKNGHRYAAPVEATFQKVQIKTGQKKE